MDDDRVADRAESDVRYRLHCFAQSGNAYKVALYLNCAKLAWEPLFVDFFRGATRTPEFRTNVNEMGEVPVLEVDGLRLTQSGAILTLLSERTGAFAPKGESERYDVLRWMLFDNHKFTSHFATLRFFKSFAPKAVDPAVFAYLKQRTEGAFAVVEQHLSKAPFMAAERPTIADFSLVGYMFYPKEESGFDLASDYPNLFAWTERMRALAGFVPPYELMPGERMEPLR
jgi:glutathione S-transferase